MPGPDLVFAEPLLHEVVAHRAGHSRKVLMVLLSLMGFAVLLSTLGENAQQLAIQESAVSMASAQPVARLASVARSAPMVARPMQGWSAAGAPDRPWYAASPSSTPYKQRQTMQTVHAVSTDAGPLDKAIEFVKKAVTDPDRPPKGVVITGGANGVGYAYADSFMKRGHSVVICDIKDPEAAVASLQQKYKDSSAKVYGTVTDVSDADSVQKLGDFAKEKLGTIHYWINNAGINGGRRPFTTLSTGTLEAVVKVDLIGVLLCTKVALEIMQKQAGVEGHIFNTVGSGVKGGGTPGYAAYGACKRGLPQLTASLVKELNEGVPGFEVEKPAGTVNCHTLSPGMVFTKLLLDDSTPELRKFPFGVLAAQPEEVGEDLVPKILGTTGNGKSVNFLTTDKTLFKFFQKFVLKKKSDYIDDDGNVIKMPGAQYDDMGVRKLY